MDERAFTCEYNKLSNRLITEANVVYNGSKSTVTALWDTGATRTCISKEVVSSLQLIPLGKQKIHTPSGYSVSSTYQVDIILPNKVGARNVVVIDSEIGTQNIGVLIGMDLISQGDFAVSSFNGKTVFTFRVPSQKRTDYVVEVNLKNVIGPTHGKGKRKRK